MFSCLFTLITLTPQNTHAHTPQMLNPVDAAECASIYIIQQN